MENRENLEGLEGIIKDPETGVWLVLSKTTPIVMPFDTLRQAIAYARETEAWV